MKKIEKEILSLLNEIKSAVNEFDTKLKIHEDNTRGRVRSVVFFNKILSGDLKKCNLTNAKWWEENIKKDYIKIIPATRGIFDGGSILTVEGFGEANEKTVGSVFTVIYYHLRTHEYSGVYEYMTKNRSDYIFAYREGLNGLRVASGSISYISVQEPLMETLTDDPQWQIVVQWKQGVENLLPAHFDMRGDVLELISDSNYERYDL
jgi:hypothetical protein